jgi:hypothetical protein
LAVVFGDIFATDWVLKEECIMHVSCRVGLRLEQRIKVPERRLNEPIGGHLIEAHL